jgi:hypothetical protein
MQHKTTSSLKMYLVYCLMAFATAACGSSKESVAEKPPTTQTAVAAAVHTNGTVQTGTPLPETCSPSQAPAAIEAADAPDATLDQRIASVLPMPAEERFLSIPWRTNLMAARAEAQSAGKPIFLWIMVGNPQGCT